MNNQMECIYCGGPATVPKNGVGEHILPSSIGGKRTILMESSRLVCEPCNNRVLSQVDNELTRHSYLAVVASQEIESTLWQVWNVDEGAERLLIEARPNWKDQELATLVNYPQIVFERDGPQIRGDFEEMKQFGVSEYRQVIIKAARRAIQEYGKGKDDSLKFDQVQSSIIERGYRLPPRLFARRSIKEIAKKVHKEPLRLRYASADDKKLALRMLSRIDSWPDFNQFRTGMPSSMPTVASFFDATKTMRGLMKIGYNLVAAYCKNTTVNSKSFSKVIRTITGQQPNADMLLAANGFVHADGIQDIKVANAHSFRLLYSDSDTIGRTGEWWVFMSFFGGRIGAAVTFPGPNGEKWNSLDIAAPIKQKKWPEPVPYNGYYPQKVQIEWIDVKKIVPSLKSQYVLNKLQVDGIRSKSNEPG
jgi:hypothetical protein